MPAHFQLTVEAGEHSAEFRLLDAHGSQLAYRHTDFQTFTPSHRYGLFDLSRYLEIYAQGQEQAALNDIGVCIAEQVLGSDIFTRLWQGESQRTLLVRLPGPDQAENPLAAALARVPWEIAKPSAAEKTLGERNLLVRVEHAGQPPDSRPIELAQDEALRVLLVFAEARGSQPLDARQERLELLKLFEQEIYPQRRVVAHSLSHGVTRQRLVDQIQQHGGYHIVHWSGHGHQNLLELAQPGGAQDLLSGEELLQLFVDAGGFPPRLVFLSACHSGDSLRVADWDSFLAVAQGQTPGRKAAAPKDLDLRRQPGFTGTAQALLQGGVPTVVAMRYAVGDDYARRLALEFYRALLAHPQPKHAAAALNLARKALLQNPSFELCDHATPLLYGAEQPGLSLLPGRSPASNPRNPRLHAIAELAPAEHRHFVGRTWELAGLGAGFIGSRSGAEVKPIAAITGLGGMGKTALVAEALALWQTRFDWVLLYQAKPQALGFDAMLRDMHQKLYAELGRYHDHVKAHRADAIYRDADAGFSGPERLERLTRNLLRALQDEAILLVLDNFETNLKPQAEAAGPLWACQDPAWEHCLQTLGRQLAGSPSRVLLTSRRPLAALADGAAYVLPLGPLPPGEAALYLRSHPQLQRMACGGDADAALALRLLNTSRFHPLLMDRLARLAADAALRPQLAQALDTLEQRKDYAQLPALFAAAPGDSQELAYLDDALSVSLDQLLGKAGSDARQLLWLIALANEPVARGLLEGVWNSAAPARPPLQSLLNRLASLGLATAEPAEPPQDNPSFSCHELVRERILAWMAGQPAERGEWSETAVRLAYAQRLAALFEAWQHQNMSAALQAGSQALVYAVQAEAWKMLGGFAGAVVTGSNDPRLLESLLPHLYSAAEAAPQGKPRWSCLCYLADALRMGGRPDAALPFYQQAASLARAATEAGGDSAREAWAILGWISGNWAVALTMTCDLDAARRRQLESAHTKKHAGQPAIHVIASELEALRIDIMQGQVETALPQIEARLEQVAAWWRQQRAGHTVPEAPDAEFLARVYLGALDIAIAADYARQDWASALLRLDAMLEAERALRRSEEDIGATRCNRASVLMEFPNRYGEAKAELEACLALFHNNPTASAKVLSMLADLFDAQGDPAQAIAQQRRALALCEQLPDPADRAISHHNLANYLERRGGPADLAEAARHQLAGLVYRLVAGLGQHMQTSLHNYAIDFRRAQAAGSELAVPRLAQLLADPAFQPLAHWLDQRQVDLDGLQTALDQLLAQVRQQALV